MNLKLKDFFTVATVVLGFAAVILAATGEIERASILIVLGGFFDLGDGYVARLTKTQNKFGAEFDCIADLVVYSFAPSVVIFYSFKEINIWYGFIIGVLPLLFGCLRLARFNVKRVEYPAFWIGLPRPGVAAVIVSFLNSFLYIHFDLFWLGGLIVCSSSILCVSLVPFPGHHNRNFPGYFSFIVVFVVVSVACASLFGLVWDVLFFYSFLYLISPVFSMSKTEKERFRAFIKAWRHEEKAEL